MKKILYILALSFTFIACKKDYECITTIVRSDNDLELAKEIKLEESQSKNDIKDIEGVQYKTYLGMDAVYTTICSEQ